MRECECVCVRACTCKCVWMYLHFYVRMKGCMYACISVLCPCAYPYHIHTHICVDTYICTNTHTRMYTQTHKLRTRHDHSVYPHVIHCTSRCPHTNIYTYKAPLQPAAQTRPFLLSYIHMNICMNICIYIYTYIYIYIDR